MTLKLSKAAATSARDYVPALLEACAQAKCEPLKVLEDTAAYPRFRKIDEGEFLVGWFHGIADAHDLTIPQVWAELAPKPAAAPRPLDARGGARGRRRKRAPKPPALDRLPKPGEAIVRSRATGKVTIVDPADVPRAFTAAMPPTPDYPPAKPTRKRRSRKAEAVIAALDQISRPFVPPPALAIPPGGYESPAVGALTGKRSRPRKAVVAGQDSLFGGRP